MTDNPALEDNLLTDLYSPKWHRAVVILPPDADEKIRQYWNDFYAGISMAVSTLIEAYAEGLPCERMDLDDWERELDFIRTALNRNNREGAKWPLTSG